MRKKNDVMTQALILDFDGVICQTETFKLDQMKRYIEGLGLSVDLRGLYRLAGGRIAEKEQILDELLGSQERYRAVREEVLHFRPVWAPVASLKTPGIDRTLQAVKERGILLAVASNSTMERLRTALSACELLPYFDFIAPAFDLGTRNPDPYVYLYTMETLGMAPRDCMILEDSALGIQAGKAAGVRVAALRDRDGAIDQRMADVIITRIEEILDYL